MWKYTAILVGYSNTSALQNGRIVDIHMKQVSVWQMNLFLHGSRKRVSKQNDSKSQKSGTFSDFL
ncbi:hypothetical protein P6P90_11425 [Ectobacillus antri]|jgi:hypothetical protein|uniref:Uncharacterized protein n=1 Tax=Ectobacillus antri TaxID=2486280 RepID=A0ABT6H7A2_9BACI|nr:hypothetical protein [Ectobacillus antri]MDG4657120.1 hypothetical protein [Ectobacillus antri]MDG5754579.1 hypothetical protein [Ectobacillus antri]